MADEMKQIPLGGILLTVHQSGPSTITKKKRTKKEQATAHGMAPGHASRSADKNKPEPRGVKQKTAAALARRQEAFVGRSSGGHSTAMPGSQNRKKGASL